MSGLHQSRTLAATALFTCLALTACVTTSNVRSTPLQDLAEISRERAAAVQRGDLDAVMAHVAEDVVMVNAHQKLRLEGKPAMRAFLEGFYEKYPQRDVVTSGVSARIFMNGDLVIQNAYNDLTLTDRSGAQRRQFQRITQTWLRTAEGWRLIDTHLSEGPLPDR